MLNAMLTLPHFSLRKIPLSKVPSFFQFPSRKNKELMLGEVTKQRCVCVCEFSMWEAPGEGSLCHFSSSPFGASQHTQFIPLNDCRSEVNLGFWICYSVRWAGRNMLQPEATNLTSQGTEGSWMKMATSGGLVDGVTDMSGLEVANACTYQYWAWILWECREGSGLPQIRRHNGKLRKCKTSKYKK